MSEWQLITLGAVITAGFSFILDWLKNRRDERKELRDSRKDTYKEIVIFIINKITGKPFNDIEKLHMLIILFASTDMVKLWNELYSFCKRKTPDTKFNVLPIFNQIRQELKSDPFFPKNVPQEVWLVHRD